MYVVICSQLTLNYLWMFSRFFVGDVADLKLRLFMTLNLHLRFYNIYQ